MHSLSDAQLLAVWERGQRSGAVVHAALLAAQSPQIAGRDPLELSIGERDAAILSVRRATFGSRLQGYTQCPQCAQRLEFDFDCSTLPTEAAPERTEFFIGNAQFRLPTSRDLIAVAAESDVEKAARVLVCRCCLNPSIELECTDALMAEVDEQISTLDAAADIRFGFTCVSCAYVWDERLDIAAWCWDEVELKAQRLLSEVHQLASVYSWSEAQILALSDARRRAYLERCDS